MFLIVIALNGIILINACKKEKTVEDLEFDTSASEDNSLAEGTFSDISNIAFQAIENDSITTYRISNELNSLLSSCATLTKTPNGSGGGLIVVNFGPSNCQCFDGRLRRGIINISFTGPYKDPGTVVTTTFDEYYVGIDAAKMFKVTGTKTVTNNGLNNSGNMNFTVNVQGQLINSSGVTMQWTSNRNREWISGSNSLMNFTDDEYVITGNASGTNFSGTSFTANIREGLHIEFCRFITKGIFELTPAGKPVRTFNYGFGDCDNKATLTVNGKTFQITLR